MKKLAHFLIKYRISGTSHMAKSPRSVKLDKNPMPAAHWTC